MKHRNITEVEIMGSNYQKEVWEFLMCKGWERGDPWDWGHGPHRRDFSWLALLSLNQLWGWFRNCWHTENWNILLLEGWQEKKMKKKNRLQKGCWQEEKEKTEKGSKEEGNVFLLPSPGLLVPCIVRIRGSQLAKEKRGLQTHSFLITKPDHIEKMGLKWGGI